MRAGERGSAGVLVVGWMMALVLLTGVMLEVSSQLLTHHRLTAATDRAALAAADVLLGVAPGLPCVIARETLGAERFALATCEVGIESVRVSATVSRAGFVHHARARAGVPDGGQK